MQKYQAELKKGDEFVSEYVYLATEADAHIAAQDRSHQATLSALKGELIQAQQAIHRVNEELRTADKGLSDTRRAHGILRNVLKMLDEGHAIYPTSVVHDEIKRLMVTGAGK